MRSFFGYEDLDFAIGNDFINLVVAAELVLISVLDPDFVVFLELIFIDELFYD